MIHAANIRKSKSTASNTSADQQPGADAPAKARTVSVALTKACSDAWTAAYGGVLSFGRLRRALKPLVGRYGDAEIEAGFKRYVGETPIRYATPEGFVAKAGPYITGRVGGFGPANGAPVKSKADAEYERLLAEKMAEKKGE